MWLMNESRPLPLPGSPPLSSFAASRLPALSNRNSSLSQPLVPSMSKVAVPGVVTWNE